MVHPAPGHWDDTLVNALVARGTTLSGGAEGRPGVVHRLDRDTSGLMVVAKTDLAHRRLGAAIAARRVRRIYAALVVGPPATRALPTIDAAIARHPSDRKRMAVLADRARRRAPTPTSWRGSASPTCSGSSSTPAAPTRSGCTSSTSATRWSGDPTYAGGGSRRISGPARRDAEALERATPRQALHAAGLAFRHPATGEPLEFRAEWPADLRESLLVSGGREKLLLTRTP